MKEQKPSLGRAVIRNTITGEVKIYSLPGDLPRMLASVYIRKGRWTCKTIEKELASLEAFIEHNVVPGAGGRCRGRAGGVTTWEYREVPGALAGHMEDLREALAAVRRYLASEDIDAAAERMSGIEALVQDICDRVNGPLIEHSRASTAKLSQARAQRNADATFNAQQSHREWQRSADKIWLRHPTWSKMAVAVQIKKENPSIKVTPETIAKIIKSPK